MTRTMKASWKLRELLEQRCIHSTAELLPKLAERGVHLSRMQVYRLVSQVPQRLSMDALAALCDILDCTPNDLIVVERARSQQKKTASAGGRSTTASPLHTTIRRPRH